MLNIRGLIQLRALGYNGLRYPMRVEAIPVLQSCSHLHFLHAALFSWGADGTQIGYYLIHYIDGREAEIPIVVGRDLSDWWVPDSSQREQRDYVLAWKGYNPFRGAMAAKSSFSPRRGEIRSPRFRSAASILFPPAPAPRRSWWR